MTHAFSSQRVGLFLWLLSIGLLACLAPARAQLQVEPITVDFGLCLQGQVLARTVTLTNTTEASIEIQHVVANCSCTVGKLKQTRLAPGESTQLELQMESGSYEGELSRHVQVQTSAGEVGIPIKITVQKYLNWLLTPTTLVLPAGKRLAESSGQLKVRYTGTGESRVPSVSSDSPWISVEPMESTGGVFIYRVKRMAGAPSGTLRATLNLATGDPKMPSLSVLVFAPVISDLRATPNPLVMPAAKVGSRSVATVRLSGWDGAAAPQARIEGGEVRATENAQDASLAFEISLPAVQPGISTHLLRFFDGNQPALEVPVLLRAEP